MVESLGADASSVIDHTAWHYSPSWMPCNLMLGTVGPTFSGGVGGAGG